MKQLWGLGLLLVLAATLPAHADSTRVMTGGVFGNWTRENSPYVIEGDVSVPAGQSLEINEGVVVYFTGHYTFTVNGELTADVKHPRRLRLHRNDEDLILFTTDLAVNPSGWGGLRFINAEESSLADCIIEFGRAMGEDAERQGGAIFLANSGLSLANCTIRKNMSAGPGGAIAALGSEVSIANCEISDNTAGENGGVIFAAGSDLSLANVSISENSGGALHVIDGTGLSLANCSISGNRGGGAQGGGISASRAEISVANCSINGNENGGIALLAKSELSVANCSILRNRGASQGGGIYCSGSEASLTNCSINDNSAGGIYAVDNSELDLTNCSVRNNEGGRAIYRDGTSEITRVNVSADE